MPEIENAPDQNGTERNSVEPDDAVENRMPEETPEGRGHTEESAADGLPQEAVPEEGAPQEGAHEQPLPEDTRHWYIIHTYSGFERKVAESLKTRADAFGFSDQIGQILIPEEEVVELRNGKKVTS